MYELIAANKRRSVLLLIAFVGLLVLTGFAVGLLLGHGTTFTIIALVIAAVIAFASYWKADAIALAIRAGAPVLVEERVFEKSERVPAPPPPSGPRI